MWRLPQSHDVHWRSEIWKENGIGSDGGWSPQPAQVWKRAPTQLSRSLFSSSTVSEVHVSFTPCLWLLKRYVSLLLWSLVCLPRPSRVVFFFFLLQLWETTVLRRTHSISLKRKSPSSRRCLVRLLSAQLTSHAKYNRTLWQIHQSSCQCHLCIVF